MSQPPPLGEGSGCGEDMKEGKGKEKDREKEMLEERCGLYIYSVGGFGCSTDCIGLDWLMMTSMHLIFI